MDNKARILGGAAIAIILAANAWVIWNAFGRSSPGGRREQSFYSTDDGSTWFADDASRLTPFDHDGKPAVLAHVYASGGKRWCAYLEQYTPRARKLMESVEKKEIGPEKLAGIMLKEVKKPGAARWVTPADGKVYIETVTVDDATGGGEHARPVGPAD